jgi:hypothetical protein
MLSPTKPDDPGENSRRFRALLDIDAKIKRMLSNYEHAADELGD